MEYMNFSSDQSEGKILCCQCGVPIPPNPANMCVGCLRTRVDITEGIPKQVTIYFCQGCERYLQPPNEWIQCSLESKELLSFCLKKLKGLNRLKLVDAGFVWTEPHSKRIKVKLTVHGEVAGGAVLQQVFVVEYIVANQMCGDCHRTAANKFWTSSVQIRQRCESKRTLYYLEQLLLKYHGLVYSLALEPARDGLDFFYANEHRAARMVNFLENFLPCKTVQSSKVVSHDVHSNSYCVKFIWSVEIVPLCKDSVVCLPKKLAQKLGGIGSLCLVLRITNTVHLIHPATRQIAEVSGAVFWRGPFNTVCSPSQMIHFVVMDIEVLNSTDQQKFRGQGPLSTKHLLADVWVVKSSEYGRNMNWTHTRTHLGAILRPGDTVLGYNLRDFNINDENFEKLKENEVPDVILVKKFYERKRERRWRLMHLKEGTTYLDKTSEDYQNFLKDLEEDPDYRQNVNMYRNKDATETPVAEDDLKDPTAPVVTLAEMLENLQVDEEPMED